MLLGNRCIDWPMLVFSSGMILLILVGDCIISNDLEKHFADNYLKNPKNIFYKDATHLWIYRVWKSIFIIRSLLHNPSFTDSSGRAELWLNFNKITFWLASRTMNFRFMHKLKKFKISFYHIKIWRYSIKIENISKPLRLAVREPNIKQSVNHCKNCQKSIKIILGPHERDFKKRDLWR